MSDTDTASVSAPLTDIWYFAATADALRAGQMTRRFILGQPVALGRTASGTAFAVHDVCPHRAAPLSAGRIVEVEGRACLECPYHGWKIGTADGACRQIPALSASAPEAGTTDKIRTPVYPLHESRGVIWIYVPGNLRRFDGVPALPPPDLPEGVPGTAPRMVIRAVAEGPYDEAVIGLIDPAHTPYVHQQWFWRDPAKAAEKVKDYEPSPLGFRMKAHTPSANGRAYRLLGGALTTQIEFRLPGLRLELIRNERHTILGLTAITPTRDQHADITQVFFWDHPLLALLRPFAQPLANRFLGQDGQILRLQNENLALSRSRPLYVGDADRLAHWYMRLKRAYLEGGGAAFVNPIEPATLRWRT